MCNVTYVCMYVLAYTRSLQPFLRRRKYKLFAAFMHATAIKPVDKPVEFEVSIGKRILHICCRHIHMWYMPRKGLCLLAVLMPVDLPLFQSYISGVTSVHMPVFAPSVSRTFSQAHPFLGKLRLRYTYKWYTYVRLGAVSTYFASMYVQT